MILNIDLIEKRVRECLESVATELTSKHFLPIRKHSTKWTQKIKDSLSNLASTIGLESTEKKEWLYDICWYKEKNIDSYNWLTRIPLVLECEWSPDHHVDGDFQKLIQARADLRVWIFYGETEEKIQLQIESIKKAIYFFEESRDGDRYLFAAFSKQSSKFLFYPYLFQKV